MTKDEAFEYIAAHKLDLCLSQEWRRREKREEFDAAITAITDAAREQEAAAFRSVSQERDEARQSRDSNYSANVVLSGQLRDAASELADAKRELGLIAARLLEVTHEREVARVEIHDRARAAAAMDRNRVSLARRVFELEGERDEARAIASRASSEANRLGAELAAGPKRAALYLALRESGVFQGIGRSWCWRPAGTGPLTDVERSHLDAAAARLAGWGDAQMNALREEIDPDRRDAALYREFQAANGDWVSLPRERADRDHVDARRYRALRSEADRGRMIVSAGGDTMDEAADALVRAQG